jgi:glc operon protein GlcG
MEGKPMSRNTIRSLSAFIIMCFILATAAHAQAPAPAYGMPIGVDAAKKAAAAAIAEAKKNSWFMAFAIVDTAGNLVYFEKMDGTQTGSVNVAIEKARSAALFKRPTKAFQDGVAQGGVGLRLLGLPGAVPVDGGIPLIEGGKIVGAIGASGGTSEQDGQAAQAGVNVIK